jgi:hypothetical protein
VPLYVVGGWGKYIGGRQNSIMSVERINEEKLAYDSVLGLFDYDPDTYVGLSTGAYKAAVVSRLMVDRVALPSLSSGSPRPEETVNYAKGGEGRLVRTPSYMEDTEAYDGYAISPPSQKGTQSDLWWWWSGRYPKDGSTPDWLYQPAHRRELAGPMRQQRRPCA